MRSLISRRRWLRCEAVRLWDRLEDFSDGVRVNTLGALLRLSRADVVSLLVAEEVYPDVPELWEMRFGVNVTLN